MYVILRKEDNKYVGASGYETYVDKLEQAQLYETYEVARKSLCIDNEAVYPLLSFFNSRVLK